MPIGNLTSQLFANVYMNAFDHFIKDDLRERFYIRYTDDAVILDQDQERLRELIPWVQAWLWRERRLDLHPRKVEVRNFRQGIDFLGYVTRPQHRVLRTRTKRRIIGRVNSTNISSYMGILEHCEGFDLKQSIVRKVQNNG